MNEHTPGPWIVHPYLAHVGATGQPARDVGPHGMAAAVVIGEFDATEPGAECEANAKLIAAAPELLAACREALDFTKDKPSIFSDVESADRADLAKTLSAAIAKATGASS